MKTKLLNGYLISLLALTYSCGDDKKGDNNPPPENPMPDESKGEEQPDDRKSDNNRSEPSKEEDCCYDKEGENGPMYGNGGSSDLSNLQNLNLAGSLAIGLGERSATTGLHLTAAAEKAVTLLNGDGTLSTYSLTELGFNSQATMEHMISVEEYGVFLKGSFGWVNEEICGGEKVNYEDPNFNPEVIDWSNCQYYNYEINLVWIQNDGKLRVIQPKDFGENNSIWLNKVQYTNGRLWVHFDSWAYQDSTRAVGYFDFANESFKRITDAQQQIDNFVATSTGSVFLQGSVKSTGFGFIRRVKETSNGFENIDNFPTFSYGNKAFASSWGNYSGEMTQVIEVVSDKMNFSYLPFSISNNFNTYGSGFQEIQVPIVGGKWLITRQTSGLLAFDIGTGAMPGSPFDGYGIDDQNHLVWDGMNVIKVEHDGTELKTSPHKTLKYSEAIGRVHKVFGPKQGFNSGWKGIMQPVAYWGDAAQPTYLVDIDPATGEADVNNMITLLLSNDNFTAEVQAVFQVNGQILVALQRNSGEVYSVGTPDAENFADLTLIAGLSNEWQLPYTNMVDPSGNKLYYSNGSTIKSYDGSAVATAYADLNDFATADTYLNSVYCLSVEAGTGKPQIISYYYNYGSAQDEIKRTVFNSFSDWTESSTNVLGNDSNPINYNEKRCYEAGFNTSSSRLVLYHQSYYWGASDEDVLILAEDYQSYDKILNKQAFSSDYVKEIAKTFGNKIEVIAPFGDSKVLVSGLISNQYRSKLYNLDDDTVENMDDLNGVQVYYGTTLGQNFVMNGLNVGENLLVNKTYRTSDKTEENSDSQSGVKVIKLIERPEELVQAENAQ